jgi:hypothetical protein
MLTVKRKLLALGVWLGVAVICLPFGFAHADTVFDTTGTFFGGTTFSGTLTIDLVTGNVDIANLVYGGATYSTIQSQGSVTENGTTLGYGVFIGTSASNLPSIHLLIPGTSAVDSLVSYAGGPLCSSNDLCGPDTLGNYWVTGFHDAAGGVLSLQTGELTAVPLPAALPLFATGLGFLGLLGWPKKRKEVAA